DEEQEIQRFIHDIEKSGMPSNKKDSILENVSQFAPVSLLKKEVFDALDDQIHVEVIKPSEKERILAEDNYTAVVEIPEQFSYDTLKHVFLDGKRNAPVLQIYQNEENRITSAALTDVLEQFQEKLTLMSFAENHGVSQDILDVNEDAVVDETDSIHQGEPVSSTTYYAIGMAVLYVMFVATLTGFWAYYEKKVHVFNRVIISNVSSWIYLFGIFVTGTVIGFIHLTIVYGFSFLLYSIRFPDLTGFLVITVAISMAVGGLAAWIASMSYRMDSRVIINLFASFIIYILGFIGGSFFPIGDYSRIIQMIGNATPNGAG